MTDFVFVTACPATKLVDMAFKVAPFSVTDNQLYTEFASIIEEELNVSDAQSTQIALNALAYSKYVQIGQPTSWYFKKQSNPRQDLFEPVVLLESEFGVGHFLILDECDDVAVLMLLSASMQLTETKSIKSLSAIKVMQNRISSIHRKPQTKTRYKAS